MSTVSDTLRLCFPSLGDALLQKMNALREDRRFCDVTLVLQGAPALRFPGHRVVLAASSSFLRDQFLLHLRDGREELALGGEVVPNAEVGRRLLLSCYTGVLDVPLRELVGYLTAASALQMAHVVERCAQAVSQYLDPTLAHLKQEMSPETTTPQLDDDDARRRPPSPFFLDPGAAGGEAAEAAAGGGFREDPEYAPPQGVRADSPAPCPATGAHRRKQRPPTPCRLRDCQTLSQPGSPAHTSGLADSSQGEDQGEGPGPGDEVYVLAAHVQGGGASHHDDDDDDSRLRSGAGLAGAGLGEGPGVADGLSQRAYLCRRCDQVFQHLDSYVRHLREHCQYLCLLCGRSFSQKSNLTRHMRVHTGVKPFQCPLCHKTFSQKATLQDHLNLHTGDKPHKCNYCAVHFAHKPGLRRHLKDIHGKSSLQNVFEELVG